MVVDMQYVYENIEFCMPLRWFEARIICVITEARKTLDLALFAVTNYMQHVLLVLIYVLQVNALIAAGIVRELLDLLVTFREFGRKLRSLGVSLIIHYDINQWTVRVCTWWLRLFRYLERICTFRIAGSGLKLALVVRWCVSISTWHKRTCQMYTCK